MNDAEFLLRMRSLRALTIRPPWSGLIVDGHKFVENRSRRAHFRGAILIHAGSQIDPKWGEHPHARSVDCTFAAFVGIARISECVDVRELKARLAARGQLKNWERDVAVHPYTDGPFGLVLRNVHKFETPIAAVGRLGLWKPLPEHLEALLPVVRRWTPDASLLVQL